MKRKLLALLLTLGLAVPVVAQITIPNTFAPSTIISSTKVNENFTTLGNAALDRTGGTLTGNMLVDANITIDGVDISDFLISTGQIRVNANGTAATPAFSHVTFTDTGFYFPADGQVALALDGVLKATFAPTVITVVPNLTLNAGSTLTLNEDLSGTAVIVTANLTDLSVTTVKLADGAVTVDKLGANAVTTAKILNGTILAEDLAAGVTGAYTPLAQQTSTVGTDADTVEKTLWTFTMGANELDENGDRLIIRAVVVGAANTNTKTVRLKFGSATYHTETITGSGAVATYDFMIIRDGSGSQRFFGYYGQGDVSPIYTTASENLAAPVVISITGQNGSAVANDVELRVVTLDKVEGA